jgi:hypothetical protein
MPGVSASASRAFLTAGGDNRSAGNKPHSCGAANIGYLDDPD